MSIEPVSGSDPSPAAIATAVAHRPSLWRQGDFMKLCTGQSISPPVRTPRETPANAV